MATVGVEGEYYLNVKLANTDLEITTEDFIQFTITEMVGGIVPIFSMEFNSKKDKMLQYLHEGNDIEVTMGRSAKNSWPIKLTPLSIGSQRAGSNKRNYKIEGMITSHQYSVATGVRLLGNKSSMEAIKAVASQYFNIDISPEQTDDKMTWAQPSWTDKTFISHMIQHAWVENGWFAHGVTSVSKDGRGTMRVFDMAQQIKDKSKAKFLFSSMKPCTTEKDDSSEAAQKSGKTTINYNGDYQYRQNPGLINTFMGNDQLWISHIVESSESDTFTTTPSKDRLTNSDKYMRRTGLSPRLGEINYLNDNVHPNFFRAQLANDANQALFSSVKLILRYGRQFWPIQILDIAEFEDTSSENPSQKNEIISGHYVVCKVSRIFANNTVDHIVELCREGPNGPEGKMV